MLPTHIQGKKFLFLVNKNLRTEEDSTDIKSFITTDNNQEKTNEEFEKPEYNVSDYFKVLNQIKQLSAFTLQKGNVDGYDPLKTQKIILKKVIQIIK